MRPWAPAALACMGVVFGDIGTSPLYTLNRSRLKSASPIRTAFRPGGGPRHRLADLLVADDRHHLDKIAVLIMRADNHGEGGILALLALVKPAPRQAEQMARRHGGDRPDRGHAVIWRRHDNRQFWTERDRGADDLRAPDGTRGRPIDGRHPRHPVSHPAQGHFLDRRDFRADHADLVPCCRRARRGWNREVARRARRAQPLDGRDLSLARRAIGPGGDRRRLPGGDRWRSVLRRHGPFRRVSHLWHGSAWPALTLNYFGQGGLLLAEPNS